MSYVGNVTIGGTTHLVGSTLYGTCIDSGLVPTKTVSCNDFDQLIAGVTIHIYFRNAGYSNLGGATLKLNVNSTGAIEVKGLSDYEPVTWKAGQVLSFTYDGTYWRLNDISSKVEQAVTTNNETYPVLLSGSSDTTNSIYDTAKKTSNLLFNPSTGNLQTTQLNGVTIGSSPKFTDTHRPIWKDGTEILGNNSTPIDIKGGSNVTLDSLLETGATGIQINATNNRRSYFGTCNTAGATASKEVTLANTDGWELVAGVIVGVKFTNKNTASNVTLDVNNSGAKSIFFSNAVYTGSATQITGAGSGILTFYMYDGTYWVFLNAGDNYRDTNSQDITTYRAQYTRPTASANNGIYRYTLFGRCSDGTYASFANSGATSTKSFDTTDYFDISKIYYNSNSSGTSAGAMMAENTMNLYIGNLNMQYSANGVTGDSTSSLAGGKSVYLVFDKNSSIDGSYYKCNLCSCWYNEKYLSGRFARCK